jgi:hypothetical protein
MICYNQFLTEGYSNETITYIILGDFLITSEN